MPVPIAIAPQQSQTSRAALRGSHPSGEIERCVSAEYRDKHGECGLTALIKARQSCLIWTADRELPLSSGKFQTRLR
jgi:hypothetical protein